MKTKVNVIVLISISIITILSCKGRNAKDNEESYKIEYLKPQVVTFYDSVYTSFPGKLLVTNDYVSWTEPKSAVNFLHIVNRCNAKKVTAVGNIGGGPYDFTAPFVEKGLGNEIVIYDLIRKKKASIQIDSLNRGIKYEGTAVTKEPLRFCKLSEDKEMVFSASASSPFGIIDGMHIYYSGKFPIENPEISERSKYNRFQGVTAYNPVNEILLYSTYSFRYMALYKREDVRWRLVKETKVPNYTIKNGSIRFEKKENGVSEVAMTKNYIVTAEYRDKDVTEKDLGQDQYVLPEVLCLYDYNLHLRKVLEIGKPIMRIGGNPDSDTIFAIIENPEYEIVTISH